MTTCAMSTLAHIACAGKENAPRALASKPGGAMCKPSGGDLCPVTTSVDRSMDEELLGEQKEDIRAYKLGKKKCSYNQVEMTYVNSSDPLQTNPVIEALEDPLPDDVPPHLRDSTLAYSLRLQCGARLKTLIYLVYAIPQAIAGPGGKPLYQWTTVTRERCAKHCEGKILRAIQRFGKLGRRNGSKGGAGDTSTGRDTCKESRHMFISIDEASTHVQEVNGARKFRLLIATYDETNALVGSSVSGVIRVLANNDVPGGAAFITLTSRLSGCDTWPGEGGVSPHSKAMSVITPSQGSRKPLQGITDNSPAKALAAATMAAFTTPGSLGPHMKLLMTEGGSPAEGGASTGPAFRPVPVRPSASQVALVRRNSLEALAQAAGPPKKRRSYTHVGVAPAATPEGGGSPGASTPFAAPGAPAGSLAAAVGSLVSAFLSRDDAAIAPGDAARAAGAGEPVAAEALAMLSALGLVAARDGAGGYGWQGAAGLGGALGALAARGGPATPGAEGGGREAGVRALGAVVRALSEGGVAGAVPAAALEAAVAEACGAAGAGELARELAGALCALHMARLAGGDGAVAWLGPEGLSSRIAAMGVGGTYASRPVPPGAAAAASAAAGAGGRVVVVARKRRTGWASGGSAAGATAGLEGERPSQRRRGAVAPGPEAPRRLSFGHVELPGLATPAAARGEASAARSPDAAGSPRGPAPASPFSPPVDASQMAAPPARAAGRRAPRAPSPTAPAPAPTSAPTSLLPPPGLPRLILPSSSAAGDAASPAPPFWPYLPLTGMPPLPMGVPPPGAPMPGLPPPPAVAGGAPSPSNPQAWAAYLAQVQLAAWYGQHVYAQQQAAAAASASKAATPGGGAAACGTPSGVLDAHGLPSPALDAPAPGKGRGGAEVGAGAGAVEVAVEVAAVGGPPGGAVEGAVAPPVAAV